MFWEKLRWLHYLFLLFRKNSSTNILQTEGAAYILLALNL